MSVDELVIIYMITDLLVAVLLTVSGILFPGIVILHIIGRRNLMTYINLILAFSLGMVFQGVFIGILASINITIDLIYLIINIDAILCTVGLLLLIIYNLFKYILIYTRSRKGVHQIRKSYIFYPLSYKS